MELRSIGYMEVSSVARNSTGVVPRVPDPEEAIASLPRPDLSQMIPYKPKVNALPGEHPVPGKCISFFFIRYCILSFSLCISWPHFLFLHSFYYYYRWNVSFTTCRSTIMYDVTTTWLF